jgi:hypothetical protein
MPSAGFEPAISAIKQLQTHALRQNGHRESCHNSLTALKYLVHMSWRHINTFDWQPVTFSHKRSSNVHVVKVRVCSASVSLKQAMRPTVCLFRRIRGCYNISQSKSFKYSGTRLYRNRKGPKFFPLQSHSVSCRRWKFGSLRLYSFTATERFPL